MMTEDRNRWQGLGAFAATEVRVQIHEYLSIMTSILVQVIFIFFVWLLDDPLLPYAVLGAMVFSIFTIGERILNEAAYVRLDHKLNELYHASPLTPESYFLGMGLGVLLAYLPPVVLLGLLEEYLHPFSPLALGVLLVSLGAVWTFAASVGYMLSTLFREMKVIWSYSTLLFNLFGILPPVFYPLFYLHGLPRELALLLPPSAAAAICLHATGLLSLTSTEIVLASVALSVEALTLFLVAILWARRYSRER